MTADGVLLVCEPVDRLPMAQRCFLFCGGGGFGTRTKDFKGIGAKR
jgi:hypothetical protein